MDPETKTNHGTLTVEALTKAGKARTVYIEPGTYRIALFDVYIALIPANEEWAGYLWENPKKGEKTHYNRNSDIPEKNPARDSVQREAIPDGIEALALWLP